MKNNFRETNTFLLAIILATSKLRVLYISSLLILNSVSYQTFAWSYQEHKDISFKSFSKACSDLLADKNYFDIKEKLEYHCTEERKFCYAHMVSIAGDHAGSPKDFYNAKSGEYLLNDEIDCQDISNINFKYSDVNTKVKKLVGNSFENWFEYGELASNNASHFQPDSVNNFENFITIYQDDKERPDNITNAYKLHAFSMHHLQDSFSSGHIGIDRTVLQQDYSGAYHDDISNTGIFLKSKTSEWHSYGDQHLGDASVYITIPKDSIDYDLITKDIQDNTKIKIFNRHRQRFNEQIDSVINKNDFSITQIISIPGDDGENLFKLCNHMSNCDKYELIIVGDDFFNTLSFDENNIVTSGFYEKCRIKNGNVTKLLKCNKTEEHVTEQSKNNIKILLLQLVSEQDTRHIQEDINNNIANEYKPFIPKENIGIFNHAPYVLTYDDYRSTGGPYEKYMFANWGFAAQTQNSDFDKLDSTSVSLNLYKNFGQLGLENRYEIVDTDGNVLNNIDIGMTSAGIRIKNNVFGVSPKALLGVNNLTTCSSLRNLYAGFGLKFDIHAGSHIFYFDIDQLYSDSFNHENTLRFVFGFRVASLEFKKRDD